MGILEQYYRVSQVLGTNIHINPDGSLCINTCALTAKGDRLDIDKTLMNIQDLEKLAKRFKARTPLALNLSGKGILLKQIEKIGEIDQGNFNKILPNGNIDDFYVQNFISGNQSFVSVIRKSEADKWISLLTGVGFAPMALSLGPFSAEHILPQLNIYGTEISFNGNIIARDEQGNWKSCNHDNSTSAPFVLKVELEVIDEKLVMPYAAAFQVILASKLDLIRAEVPALEETFRNKLTDLKLKANGSFIVFIFFALLLINYLAFSSLSSSNARLASHQRQFARNTSNAKDIAEQIRQKEHLLEKLGWEGGINKSVLADQLASLMPEEIRLKEMALDPIDINTSRMQRQPIFFKRRITISGISDNIIPVNEWMARIKTRPWVKNLQLENYTYNNELNTGRFTIILNY